MVLPGLVFENSDFTEDNLTLDEDQFHHFMHVMRLKTGDIVHISNGNGVTCRGILTAFKKSATINVDHSTIVIHKKPPSVTIAVGIAKDSAFENLLRQTTELGVSSIIPVIFNYSTVSEKIFETRRSRFEKIILSACEQCRTPFKPNLMKVCSINDLCQESNYSHRILFYENANTTSSTWIKTFAKDGNSLSPNDNIIAAIGPEGGITPEEVTLFESHNFTPLLFQSNILRVDTASAAAVTLLRNLM